MTSTRIELAFNKVARMNDASDLAELLFPGNRNQQHAFLVIWISLKWETPGLVPNLNEPAQQFGISRRTLERVRAKLRRLGLIDHVSRFNARHGYREGWVSSPRFEHSLRQLADKVAVLRNAGTGSREKDELLLQLAAARRASAAGPETSSNRVVALSTTTEGSRMKTHHQGSSVVPSVPPPLTMAGILGSAHPVIPLPHENAGPPRPLPVQDGGELR
jgi:hypothetical protein